MENATDNGGIRALTERGVKVAISMLWYSGAELSRGLLRLAGRSPSARFVVLYYHEVPDEARSSLRSSNASAFARHDGRARRARRAAP